MCPDEYNIVVKMLACDNSARYNNDSELQLGTTMTVSCIVAEVASASDLQDVIGMCGCLLLYTFLATQFY